MRALSMLSCILLFFVISLSGFKKNEAAEPNAPNILFILADDWSYPYAGIYGDHTIQTPNLDRLAQHGTVFTNAFSSTPSCTASRASILSGRYPHNLGEGVNLCGKFDVNIPTYVQLMDKAGYAVGFDRKGWAPGDFRKMGYTQNPAGTKANFTSFMDQLPQGKPFFFWFGTEDPHRPLDTGGARRAGIDLATIKVPAFLPDVPEIREDIGNYLSEIVRIDREIGEILSKLEHSGKLENTIIVVASDNGMPFPHAKANLYDYGTRVPLLISRLGSKHFPAKRSETFVNLIDLMPTFLDWAGIKKPDNIDGISLVPVINGKTDKHRSEVYLERERHCLCRADFNYGAGYPMRAIRTKDYLYIRNFRPDRNPAGDESIPGTPSVFGDVDGGPTKIFMMDHRHDPAIAPLFKLGFGKRPAEELYILKDDPYNVRNRAADPAFAAVRKDLARQLEHWMLSEKDPRLNGGGDEIDRYISTSRAWITRDGIILLDE